MEIKPPVAIAIIVLVVLIAGYFLFKSTGSARFKPPPPIMTGTPLQPGQLPAGQAGTGPQIQGGAPTLPGAPPGGQAQYNPGK